MERSLVIGANGQVGSELVEALAATHGEANVIAADIGAKSLFGAARYERVDVLDRNLVAGIIDRRQVTQVYHLAALLSATAEQKPLTAWELNMNGLLNVLEIARERGAARPLRIFWPSSIGAFGPHTPGLDTPQTAVMDPTTIYGISKLAGERLCEYYFARFGVDVRSIRYPGIISHKAPPGGGTTDYAIAMFHAARRGERYVCYLRPDTTLPMIYMPDAIRATVELMEAPAGQVRIRSSYNVAGVSFSTRRLADAISLHVPQFEVAYQPDGRQEIADSWPQSLDDAHARADWGWRARVNLDALVVDMLKNIHAPSDTLHRAA